MVAFVLNKAEFEVFQLKYAFSSYKQKATPQYDAVFRGL